MKGNHRSKDSLELDKENSIINNKLNTEEFSQIDIDMKGKNNENLSAPAEIQRNEQVNIIENNPDKISNNQKQIQSEVLTTSSSKYETLDESYIDTFVIIKIKIKIRKEIFIEFCIN